MRTEEIGEILNISLSAGSAAVAELVDKEARIVVNRVEQVVAGSLSLAEYEPTICFEYEFKNDISDNSLVIMRGNDVAALVGAILQKEFTDEFNLDEVNTTAATQVIGDFLGESFAALSNFASVNIGIDNVDAFAAPETETLIKEYYNADQSICCVRLGIVVNGLIDSDFVLLMNEQQAEGLVGTFNSGLVSNNPATSEAPAQEEETYVASSGPSYDIRPVELQRYAEDDTETVDHSSNLNMIMNVPLQITVEIGRAKKPIKDILELQKGSIVELNKQAGSHVDVFVNGQPIASGEVVVVDDYYGVRISEILNTGEIMKIL